MDDDFIFLNRKMHPLEGGKMEEFADLMISSILPAHFNSIKQTHDEYDSALFQQLKIGDFDKGMISL